MKDQIQLITYNLKYEGSNPIDVINHEFIMVIFLYCYQLNKKLVFLIINNFIDFSICHIQYN
jgi:hypothetical protein